MEAPFKSKLLTVYDYHEVDLTEYCVPFSVDEEMLQESLLSVRKKYAYLSSVSTIQKGDMVTLGCESAKGKFQKTLITVCVGKNLYSKELEAQLIGLAVGDKRTVIAEDTPVTVSIQKAERNILPELNDEFVASHFETVHTMEELKAWYVHDQLETHLQAQATFAAEFLRGEIVRKSELSIDEAERRSVRAEGERIVRETLEFNGICIDTMTDEQAQEQLGYPSARAYLNWFADLCEQDISAAVLGYDLLRKRGAAPTKEQYEAELNKLSEEENIPAPELREQYPFSAFARKVCSEYYSDLLKDYAYQYIKEKLQ